VEFEPPPQSQAPNLLSLPQVWTPLQAARPVQVVISPGLQSVTTSLGEHAPKAAQIAAAPKRPQATRVLAFMCSTCRGSGFQPTSSTMPRTVGDVSPRA